MLVPIKGHRSTAQGSAEWEALGPRWHPPREKERFCAQGRMLFLSLYEADTHKPTKKMLYDRCHEMIDLAIGALPSIEA